MLAAEPVTTVDEVAEAYVAAAAALDPTGATRQGIAGYESEMTDFSPDGVAARAELARDARTRVLTVDPTDARQQLAADVMVERLSADLDAYDAGEWRRNLNVLFSPLQEVRECFDLMPTDTADDWAALATRMAAVPASLAGIRVTLHEGLVAGTPVARRQAVACAAQAVAWGGAANGSRPYFSGLVDGYRRRAGADDGLAARLEAAAVAANGSMAELGRWLADDYAPLAGERDGVGAERYVLAARGWNGADLDLDETYRWGWEELDRIGGEMTRVAGRIQPGATLDDVRQLLESDPVRAIEGEENLRRWLQDLMDEALAGLNGTHFDIPGPLLRLEAKIAPAGGAAAQYYTGPSEDFSRPRPYLVPHPGPDPVPALG